MVFILAFKFFFKLKFIIDWLLNHYDKLLVRLLTSEPLKNVPSFYVEVCIGVTFCTNNKYNCKNYLLLC